MPRAGHVVRSNVSLSTGQSEHKALPLATPQRRRGKSTRRAMRPQMYYLPSSRRASPAATSDRSRLPNDKPAGFLGRLCALADAANIASVSPARNREPQGSPPRRRALRPPPPRLGEMLGDRAATARRLCFEPHVRLRQKPSDPLVRRLVAQAASPRPRLFHYRPPRLPAEEYPLGAPMPS